MPRSLFLLVLVFIGHFPLFAQIAIGQWRDHLPYNRGVQVADAGDWIYCASESGLFQYHKKAGDVVRLSKVNGLSDIGFSSIAWSDEHETLIIAYTNTNIDILKDGKVINVPDIKNKSILGLKSINNIHVDGDYAYLACGFGIVVFDIAKVEVKDTYYIGLNGTAIDVQDITNSEDEIYASTVSGVYRASLNSSNLANFENWEEFTEIPSGTYNACTWFNDRLYVNWTDGTTLDTVYWYEANEWNVLQLVDPSMVRTLESAYDRLLVVGFSNVAEYNSNHERLRLGYAYNGVGASPRHATIDDEGVIWIADRGSGLVRFAEDFSFRVISVDGPLAASSTGISIWDGRCYVASGGVTNIWSNLYNGNGLYVFTDENWGSLHTNSSSQTSDMRDFLRVLVDPFDSKRVYASTWGYGVVEYYDNAVVARYDTSNSSLDGLATAPNVIRTCGLDIDRSTGVLWVAASETDKLLHALDRNGNWYGYDIPGVGPVTMGDLVVDNSGQVWMVAVRGVGLVVYNHNGTLGSINDDQAKRLTQGEGNGDLASSNVYCIAVDFDGEIWVGTDNGISVFYSPESVFSGGNFDSQQILVEQDGYVQYLLENEGVTAIEVDGANRKWIGTANAGVFLMSEDGTEEIYHFTKDNSPLFSNQITSLGVDHLSGEVFIGTDKGIISFRGTATWGVDEIVKEEVYAYPNPVEPDYDGPIAIKGLVRDADVKIADASGRVVYATTAYGGQAIWDGNNLNGDRAQSGVYMVFATNEDGKETIVTKVLFIN